MLFKYLEKGTQTTSDIHHRSWTKHFHQHRDNFPSIAGVMRFRIVNVAVPRGARDFKNTASLVHLDLRQLCKVLLLPTPARNPLPQGQWEGACHRSGGESLQLSRHSLTSSCSGAEGVKRVVQFSFGLTTPAICPA